MFLPVSGHCNKSSLHVCMLSLADLQEQQTAQHNQSSTTPVSDESEDQMRRMYEELQSNITGLSFEKAENERLR